MNVADGELRIGDFSRLSQLSLRVLRHYDAIGLLVPARVDQTNGYRYYAPTQLADAQRIVVLKSLGLGLAAITTIVSDAPSEEELLGMLRMKRAEADAARREAIERLAEIDRHMADLAGTGRLDASGVVVRATPPEAFLAVRSTFDDIAAASRAVEQVTEAAADGVTGPIAVVGYDDAHRDRALDLEIGVLTDREDALRAGDLLLEPTVLPGRASMATITTTGDPELEHARALRTLGAWLAATGRRIDGPSREILHPRPDAPGAYVLQLQFPVAPDEGAAQRRTQV